jgi:hypothetical protein
MQFTSQLILPRIQRLLISTTFFSIQADKSKDSFYAKRFTEDLDFVNQVTPLVCPLQFFYFIWTNLLSSLMPNCQDSNEVWKRLLGAKLKVFTILLKVLSVMCRLKSSSNLIPICTSRNLCTFLLLSYLNILSYSFVSDSFSYRRLLIWYMQKNWL